MSRTFINTLIFEQGLDSISPSNTDLYNWALQIYNPNVRIVSDDCRTALGEKMSLGLEVMGKLHAATETTVDFDYLVTLANSGLPSAGMRGLSTCIADGGICRTCLLCSRPWLFNWAPIGGGSSPIETIFHFDSDNMNLGGSTYSFDDYPQYGINYYPYGPIDPDNTGWLFGNSLVGNEYSYSTNVPGPLNSDDFCIEFVYSAGIILV